MNGEQTLPWQNTPVKPPNSKILERVKQDNLTETWSELTLTQSGDGVLTLNYTCPTDQGRFLGFDLGVCPGVLIWRILSMEFVWGLSAGLDRGVLSRWGVCPVTNDNTWCVTKSMCYVSPSIKSISILFETAEHDQYGNLYTTSIKEHSSRTLSVVLSI